ncbi:MAG: hypothetical protein ABI609_00900 [Acidobacteriota bacterium]
MKKTLALALPSLLLLTGFASAKKYYVPIPTVVSGEVHISLETERPKNSEFLRDVTVTFIPEGRAGAGAVPRILQGCGPGDPSKFCGPSTNREHPLIDLASVVSSGGLAVLEPEEGLALNEIGIFVGKEASTSSSDWELPILDSTKFFAPGGTAYLSGLRKSATASSNVQIFNFGSQSANCSVKILRPKGSTLDHRDGLTVPALGLIRIPDPLRSLTTGAGNTPAAVTCDQPFYVFGAYPTVDRSQTLVHYPQAAFPTAGTATTLLAQSNTFLNCTFNNPVANFSLPFKAGTKYKVLTIDFDARTVDPNDFVVFRNIVGMSRSDPSQRFGKTLFFGNFERFDGNKIKLDLGTPFIEAAVTRSANISGLRFFHFTVTLNAEQKSIRYQIRRSDLTATILEINAGLFNENFGESNGTVPTLQFGLAGVADDAYFPPYGWKFSNLKVVAFK